MEWSLLIMIIYGERCKALHPSQHYSYVLQIYIFAMAGKNLINTSLS